MFADNPTNHQNHIYCVKSVVILDVNVKYVIPVFTDLLVLLFVIGTSFFDRPGIARAVLQTAL